MNVNPNEIDCPCNCYFILIGNHCLLRTVYWLTWFCICYTTATDIFCYIKNSQNNWTEKEKKELNLSFDVR